MLDSWGTRTAGRRGRRRLLLAGLAAILTLLGPVTAGATQRTTARQRDRASEAKALRAFDTFLSQQAADAPAWRPRADAFIASITSSCPDVLAPLNLLPTSQLDQRAMTAFGEESGADLGLATNQADSAPYKRLARTLGRLHWSRRSTRLAVARYVTTSRNLLSLPQSDLCGDARALAADNAMTTPPGTLIWLARFNAAMAALDRSTNNFLDAITRLGTAGELTLLIRTEQLAAKVDSAGKAFSKAERPKLLTALGLSSS